MNYPPNGPPPGGYGAPPPGGYGAPPPGGGYGAPPGYGPPPGIPGDMGMMAPHAPYGLDPITGMPYSDKSKMVAGLLQIFLGSFGVGRFYTGHIGIAVAQLVITLISCGTLGWCWPLIDGIMMMMGKVPDAQGRPLRD